jgi:hypothetical protein
MQEIFKKIRYDIIAEEKKVKKGIIHGSKFHDINNVKIRTYCNALSKAMNIIKKYEIETR